MTSKSKIVDRNEPVLRQTAKPVLIKDISSKKVQTVIQAMKKAVKKEDDGVAIAAPQIGESLRIFVVAGRTLALLNKKGEQKDEEGAEESLQYLDLVFINPEITKLSRKKKMMEEGCLSVRWLYGEVERSERAVIKAYDENGKKFERGASGLLAQIFQHEVDHLNGILFIDKAVNVEDIP